MARWICIVLCFVSLIGCKTKTEEAEPATEKMVAPPAEPAATKASSEPLQPLPEPAGLNTEKVLLGRALFHDPILSGDGTISCATCHSLDHGGAEPRKTSTGMKGQLGPINSPTVLNASLNLAQFWDGRAKDLQEQAEGPVANPIEMGETWENVVKKLEKNAEYRAALQKLYSDGVTKANITDAIAEYERSLLTPSRFDAYLNGDPDAITAEEKAGYETFKEVGCTACHMGVNVGGSMYQKMGLVNDYFAARGTELTDADLGRFNVTKRESDKHFFKVPSLRNVALTPPYLHDGSQESLEDTVRIMGKYQLGRDLSDEQVAAIVSFLKSLTGELPAHARQP